MKKAMPILASCLLVAVLAVTGFAQSVPVLSSLTTYNQLPPSQQNPTCSPGTAFVLLPSGGSYIGQGPGLYICPQYNVPLLFGQGANTLEVQGADFTNATATAATVLSWPIYPYGVYALTCTLFWQNSGTSGDLVLTVTTPTSPTNSLFYSQIYTNKTGTLNGDVLTGSPLAYTSTTAPTASATSYRAIVEGTIENGANAGTLAIQASASAGTTTIKRGSYCKLR
jgi:hypothetical protein